MRRVLNYLLAISFVLTIMVPITGVKVHKLCSTLFLVLTMIHFFTYRNRLNYMYYLIITLTIVSFVLGILGLIMVEHPIILTFHRTVSIVLIILLAIHIYKFHRRLAVHNVTAFIIFKVMANMMTDEFEKEIGMKG